MSLSVQNRLIEAIDGGDLAVVSSVLKKSPALLASLDEYGFTPLLRAVASIERSPELIEAFIKLGADVKFQSEEGYTALHMLSDVNGGSGTGEVPGKIARLLVAAGADVEARQHWGWTPLMLAAVEGTPDELQALVDVSGNVNHRFPVDTLPEFLCGRTTLMATIGNAAKTQILIRAGADLAAQDTHGETALEYARQCLDEDAEDPISMTQMLADMEAAGMDPDEPTDEGGLTSRQILADAMVGAFADAEAYDYPAEVRKSIAIIEQALRTASA